MVKRLENPPSGFALTAWIGVFSGPQMILGSCIFEDSQFESLAKCKLDWLGSDSVPGLDYDGFGLRDLVSCPFPQSCFKGYACNAPASCLHDCLKYVFLGEQPSLMIFVGATVVISGVSMIVITKDSKLA
jgi:hypothetical protein